MVKPIIISVATLEDAMAEASVAAAENTSGGNMSTMGMQLGAGVAMAGAMSNMMSGIGNRTTNQAQTGQDGAQNTAGAVVGAGVAMISCSKCNASVASNVKFCPNCGNSMQETTISMPKCIKCGAGISQDALFCPECGAKQVKEQHCTNCGNKLEEGVKFCPNCGNPR